MKYTYYICIYIYGSFSFVILPKHSLQKIRHTKKYVKLQTVTNLPQLRATRMLYTDLCSIFRVDSHCSSHFAVAPQKTSVFDQNLTIDSLNHFKHAQKI